MQAKQLQLLVIDALEDVKAEEIKILDVRQITDITDYMVIATGGSTRQIKALANSVTSQAKAAGISVVGVEGEEVAEWVLVDLGDVIAHIMTREMRTTYNLEKLWSLQEENDHLVQQGSQIN